VLGIHRRLTLALRLPLNVSASAHHVATTSLLLLTYYLWVLNMSRLCLLHTCTPLLQAAALRRLNAARRVQRVARVVIRWRRAEAIRIRNAAAIAIQCSVRCCQVHAAPTTKYTETSELHAEDNSL
jgi:hypothetical protein